MRIWFDLSNAPHINLFAPLIEELRSRHEIVITCRPLSNTIDLLRLHALPHTVVGVHYGARLLDKVRGYPVRLWQLFRFLRAKRIDVAISQTSFHSPVVARMLGVRSIYMNDNEHALGNVPAFAFASTIMVPEFFGDADLKRQRANPRKVVKYPGVKEGIYLWRLVARLKLSGGGTRAPGERRSVYVRPEPWTAQYYRGRVNFLDDLLLGLKDRVRLTLLPRGRDQAKHYSNLAFAGIRIVDTALDIAEIVPDCDLFVGAGGTMTREMAVLGIPTISVYQDELLGVDRYLLGQGALVHRPELKSDEALEYINHCERGTPRRELLEKGREAYEMIKTALLNG